MSKKVTHNLGAGRVDPAVDSTGVSPAVDGPTAPAPNVPRQSAATPKLNVAVPPGYLGILPDSASGATALLAPTGLAAEVPPTGRLQVNLSWTNRSFVSSVDLQRATNPTFAYGLVTLSLPAISAYTDTTVTPRTTTYYYRVRITLPGATSPWSKMVAVALVIPTAPAILQATTTAPGAATVNLTWAKGSGGMVGGFTLQRATNLAFSAGLDAFDLPGTCRSFTDFGLARASIYYYRIQAVNALGRSTFSRPIVVVTPG